MATNTQTPTLTLPVDLTFTFVLKAETEDDYQYLTESAESGGFISDMKQTLEELDIEIVSINGINQS